MLAGRPGKDFEWKASETEKETGKMNLSHWHGLRFCLAACALAMCVGCSSDSGSATPTDNNQTSARDALDVGPTTAQEAAVSMQRHATPGETVTKFLTALKAGDQPRATSMLTVTAQREMAKSEATIQPPGSSTARFQVTQVEMLGEQQDGAHVLSEWTDTEDDGTVTSHEIVWILRREPSGWAIAGFATRVFDDQPPLILNFEDPQDLQHKRDAVDAEIARRTQESAISR
jgi:hypothetical protein